MGEHKVYEGGRDRGAREREREMNAFIQVCSRSCFFEALKKGKF